MCLKNVGEKLVAQEDIECYKRLIIISKVIDEFKSYHGKKAKAFVKTRKFNIVLSVEDNKLYLCSNHVFLDGKRCKNRFGYKYSWAFDNNVKSLICEEKELSYLSYKTPYQYFPVEVGKTYESGLIEDNDNVNVGIHSFKYLVGVKKDGGGIFVKCIIPKGSHYYEGKFNKFISYASDKLTYVEIIDNE